MSRNKSFVSVVGSPSQGFVFGPYVEKMLPKVGIDLSFQSRTRWNMKMKQFYVNSILMGMNISKFILVDVKRCLSNSVEKEDIDYFTFWLDQGVEFLNVDSNNRTTTIKEFINDEVKIMHGDYFINGITYTVNSGNDTYSTMDDNFKALLHAEIIPMHIIEKATRSQLSDLFGRMNSGESLNIFEKLNASNSKTAEIIRNLSDKYGQTFVDAGLFTENQWNRRVLDGWLANIFYLFVNGTNKSFSKPVHTKWYANDSISNQSIAKFEKAFNRYMKLVKDRIPLFHYKWAFFDLFYDIITLENEYGRLDETKGDIVMDFINMFTPLVADKNATYTYNENPTEEDARFQFKQFMRGEGFNTPTRVRYYAESGWNAKDYFVETDDKRTLTRIEKQNVAVRDGWVDADGDAFDPARLFDGTLDAGHVTAYGMGGETTEDNSVIEKASKNRSKQMTETVVNR